MARRMNSALPQVSFSILLALSLRARHGYELMQQVEQDSNGLVRLGPGALYGRLKELLEEMLIEEVPSDDKRRRYYALTPKGLERLGAELEYFDQTLKVAKERKLLGDTIWAKMPHPKHYPAQPLALPWPSLLLITIWPICLFARSLSQNKPNRLILGKV